MCIFDLQYIEFKINFMRRIRLVNSQYAYLIRWLCSLSLSIYWSVLTHSKDWEPSIVVVVGVVIVIVVPLLENFSNDYDALCSTYMPYCQCDSHKHVHIIRIVRSICMCLYSSTLCTQASNMFIRVLFVFICTRAHTHNHTHVRVRRLSTIDATIWFIDSRDAALRHVAPTRLPTH